MSFSTLRTAIESRLAANWSTTPIQWENVPFPEQTGAHIACFIREGDGRQVSLGTTPRLRYAGVIQIAIFTPEQTGTALARQYGDTLAALFRRVELPLSDGGLVRCRVPALVTAGPTQGWYQATVQIPYQRDEVG